jgi:hypothetical protein
MQAIARARLWGLLFISAILLGCRTQVRLDEIDKQLAATQRELAEERRKREAADAAQEEQFDFEIRKIWGKLYCDSDQVRDFLKACENSDSASCSEQGLAQALGFMGSQPSVSFYMRPGTTGKDIHSIRHGQLAQLTDLRHIRPSTRYLVLVQPQSDTEAHQKEAQLVGREIIKLLRSEFGVSPKATHLGVRMLPCKLKAEQLKQYTRSYDQPKVGEPKSNEPRIRVWVYRTDC